MLLHQSRYEFLMFWRNRSAVFFTFVMPLLLLGLLGLIVGTGNDDYAEILVPGMAALAITSVTLQGLAIGLAWHRQQGILKTLVATPLPRPALLGAKIVSQGSVAVAEVLLIVIAGSLVFGLGFPDAPAEFWLAAIVGAAAMASMGVALASFIRSGEAAPSVTNAIYLPMIFISGVFYPVDDLPRIVEAIGTALPLYHLVELMRSAWLGTAIDTSTVLQHYAILLIWTFVAVVVASRRFRWEPRHSG